MADNELGLITFQEAADLIGIGIATFKKDYIDNERIKVYPISEKLSKVKKQDVLDCFNSPVKKDESLEKTEKSAIEKAKEATELAKEELEKVKLETQTKLQKEGWQTVKDGIDANAAEKTKLKDEREQLEKVKKEYAELVNEARKRINDANTHRALSVEMVKQATEKTIEVVKKEKSIEELAKKADELIGTLQDCYLYYSENIIPIINVIDSIKKALYREAQAWQGNDKFWNIQQFISNKIESIELFLEKVVVVEVPEELLIPVEQVTPIEETIEVQDGDDNEVIRQENKNSNGDDK